VILLESHGMANGDLNDTYSRETLSGEFQSYPLLNKMLSSVDIQGWKFNGSVLPDIIYNNAPGYKYDKTTIILWAKQLKRHTSNLINPLFSLYNNDSSTNQNNEGFYVTPDRSLFW
jgi:hypothetical protein